jgi:hypothetical protein
VTATALPRGRNEDHSSAGGFLCCDVPVTATDLSAGLSAIGAWLTRALRSVTPRR